MATVGTLQIGQAHPGHCQYRMSKAAAIRLRTEAHEANAGKRGRAKQSRRKDIEAGLPSGPILLGILLAVILGSILVQLFRSQLFL